MDALISLCTHHCYDKDALGVIAAMTLSVHCSRLGPDPQRV